MKLYVKTICRVRTARNLPIELVLVEEVVEEGDRLDRLPQTHFISQYHRVVPETCTPLMLDTNCLQGMDRDALQRTTVY